MAKTALRTVVGVPGTWPTRSEIVAAIALKSEGYVFAGPAIMDTATQQMFQLDIYGHDPALVEAFRIAGQRSLSEADLAAIAGHAATLYIVGEGGSTDQARAVMQVAAGLLRAGGIAVKVESAGVAHSAADWLALARDTRDIALYHAYVTLIGQASGSTYYSCGMHNLGCPDAEVSDEIDPSTAVRLLNGFLLYILLEQPTLAEGHTFSLDTQSPSYHLGKEPQTRYATTSLFHNPFGLWRLSPLPRPKGWVKRLASGKN